MDFDKINQNRTSSFPVKASFFVNWNAQLVDNRIPSILKTSLFIQVKSKVLRAAFWLLWKLRCVFIWQKNIQKTVHKMEPFSKVQHGKLCKLHTKTLIS